MTPELFKTIKDYFTDLEEEQCGLIVDSGHGEVFFPTRNVAEEPTKFFMVSALDWITAARHGKVKAVVHSHPNGSLVPGENDFNCARKTNLPNYIVSPRSPDLMRIDPPKNYTTFEHRSFEWGYSDCYSIMRDYLWAKFQILMHDYPKSVNFNEVSNPFEDLAEKEGFVKVSDAWRHGDVALLSIGSKVPNHCAVFVEPDLILHHLTDQLSRLEAYSLAYQKRTVGHYRHWSLQ